MMMVLEGVVMRAATWAAIGTNDAPACTLVMPCCFSDVSKRAHTSPIGSPRPSAQIRPLPPSTDNLGTTFKRLGKKPVMDSTVQVELQRQTYVMRRGNQFSPNKSRRQEGRQRGNGA